MSLPAIRRRLASGLPMAAGAIAIVLFVPDAFVPFLLAGIGAFLAAEFYVMLEAAGWRAYTVCGAAWAALLVFAGWGVGDAAWASGEMVIFFATVFTFLRAFPDGKNPAPLATVASTLFGLLYVGLLWRFSAKLLDMTPEGALASPWGWRFGQVNLPGRLLFLYGLVVAKFSDVGAYTVGSLLGRHKLAPRISPKKTWEGVAGGIALSVAMGFLFLKLCGGRLDGFGITWKSNAFLAAGLSVCAVVGDLTESLFKRAVKVKDSGGLLPGLGGMLDVFDSLFFVFPALYAYIAIFLR